MLGYLTSIADFISTLTNPVNDSSLTNKVYDKVASILLDEKEATFKDQLIKSLKDLGHKKEEIYHTEIEVENKEEELSPIKSQVIKAQQFDSLVEGRKKFSIKLNILQ